MKWYQVPGSVGSVISPICSSNRSITNPSEAIVLITVGSIWRNAFGPGTEIVVPSSDSKVQVLSSSMGSPAN